MLAGNHERETTADYLGLALSQGYLTMADYEQRLQTTFSAHTTEQLDPILVDLPVNRLRRNDPRRRARNLQAARLSVRIHLGVYLAVSVLLLGIWAAAGFGYFWPVWPIMGWGIGVVSHAIPIWAHGSMRPVRIA